MAHPALTQTPVVHILRCLQTHDRVSFWGAGARAAGARWVTNFVGSLLWCSSTMRCSHALAEPQPEDGAVALPPSYISPDGSLKVTGLSPLHSYAGNCCGFSSSSLRVHRDERTQAGVVLAGPLVDQAGGVVHPADEAAGVQPGRYGPAGGAVRGLPPLGDGLAAAVHLGRLRPAGHSPAR